MRFFFIAFLVMTAMAGAAAGPGDSVVVVYNSAMPESKDVADHYAAMRHVPESQVLGLELTTNEIVSRAEYQDKLEGPLNHFLESRKLMVFDPPTGHSRVLREAKIRYLVLCYGVPLKIGREVNFKEPNQDKLLEVLRERNDAAVDSELAVLPWPDYPHMISGFLPNPLYSTTNASLLGPVHGLLIVARLDGPNAAIARALVDKAMQAETNGLWGRAYFDMRDLPKDDPYKKGDNWIYGAASAAFHYGFEIVLDNNAATFSASVPMSQIALYAGWYDVDASGPFARPKVEFMPGAFAYHLHSYSAQTLRTTTAHWCGPLLAKGVTATMGCVQEPYLDGTPNIAVFMARWLSGFTYGEAALAAQGTLSWQTTVIGDPLYRPFGEDPRALHESLIASHSPYLEWSHLRVVDLSLAHGDSPEELVQYLQNEPLTGESAVLMEKLGNLFEKEGQHEVAVRSWERALKLKPSPLQAVRLMYRIGDNMAAAGHEKEALARYEKFLKDDPQCPDSLGIYEKMLPLADKLHKDSQARRFSAEITRLSASPAAQ